VAASPPVRGSIVSADGRELATSLEAVRIIATPYQIEDPQGAAKKLAGVLGPEVAESEKELKASLSKEDASGRPGGYSVVAVDVTPETAQRVEDLGIAGISTVPDTVRIYPDGSLASQLTGYQGDYGAAFGGVEARYDEQLKSGEDVTLTLDSAVQQELEKALAAAVEKHRAKSAVGVVMRAADGAIVALANAPSYDNNRFGEASAEAQRDRVLTDPYEPGSTFKAFTVAAALEEGAVTPASTFVVPDHMTVADHVIHDSQRHPTKVMAPGDVLRESSNVGTIQVAQALGGQELHGYIRAFGFGEATGVDLWGEASGIVPAYEDWSGVSIGNIPIGQGLTATPLQLVSGYAALVNGGHRVTPHVTSRRPLRPPDPG
jgi:cell division protein FtsI/penicillin-binding protein 2